MIKKLWLKGCPRCHGDLVLEQDRWSQYHVCIQCVHTHELPKAENRPEPARVAKAA